MNKKVDIDLIRQYREGWEGVVTDGFSDKNLEIFKKRKYAVDAYIDGVSLQEIYDRTHIIIIKHFITNLFSTFHAE